MGSQPRLPVDFGILGPLRVAAGGRELALTSPKQRRLLVALLAAPGSVVSSDRLADVLWGRDPPQDPVGSIHTHVSRLRGVLEEAAGESARELVETRPGGYALAVDPDRVDAGRFEQLLEQARAARQPQARAELAEQALGLWRGRPLGELEDELVGAEAARLEELRTGAVQLRADALIVLGRAARAAAELEPAVTRHPLREQLRGWLIAALYRCGRQAEALAAYRELRGELAAELGVEPSPELRRLERAVLQQDEQLPWPPAEAPPAGGDRREARAGRPVGTAPQLPARLTSFVGRQDDVAGVAAAVEDARLVTLTGPGGVGKSRLAVEVARRLADGYADGVRLCDLVSAENPDTVAEVAATALGVRPGDAHGAEDAVLSFLRAQELLLVLDNCEHVLAGASRLAERVARNCPGVGVLATSRRPLHAAGEHVWSVEPLPVGNGERPPAAVELFCDRAAAADRSFELTQTNRQAVEEICRQLDGLPLALELAAARVRAMTPGDIADRVDQRFRLLTDQRPTATGRHRSLQAVIDYSYELLPEPTRQLFDRLAVLVGGFGMDAAELVCAGDGLSTDEIAPRLSELVDHSLVVVDRSGEQARYRLLETLRAYGAERLGQRGELEAWRQRHAEHFAALAQEAASGLQGPDEARWVCTLDTELANLRSVQAWARSSGRVDLALRLPSRLRFYAYYRLRDEIYDWALRALALPGATDRPAYPAALVAAGVGCMQRGRLERARDHGEQALAADPDGPVVLRARQLLTEITLYQGRLGETDQRGRDLVERARAAGSAYHASLGHLYRVYAAAYAGRTGDARGHLEEGWRVVEATGNPTLRAAYHHLEGEVRLDADPEAALQAFEEAIRLAGSVGNRFIEGVARVSAASLEARHGEPGDALAAFRDIIDHWRTGGDWVHMWTTLHNLVVLLERIGAEEPAAVLHGAVGTATTGAPAYGADAERLQAVSASLRTSLGEQDFAAADARGRDMTDDEAVGYALEAIDGLLAGGG